MLISTISALEKNYSLQNTRSMPVVKIFSRLELEQTIYSVLTRIA